MGSDSKPNRDTGVLLGLDALGNVNSAPRLFYLSLLYDAIRVEVEELNIERAVIAGGQLLFLQRGNLLPCSRAEVPRRTRDYQIQ